MAESKPASEPLPGTVFTPRQVRMLKWAVIVMGIMLVGGFALVLGAIVYQASNLSESAPSTVATSSSDPVRAMAVPRGMAVTHMALDGNRLAVHLSGPRGSEIRVLDLATGDTLQRIPLTAE